MGPTGRTVHATVNGCLSALSSGELRAGLLVAPKWASGGRACFNCQAVAGAGLRICSRCTGLFDLLSAGAQGGAGRESSHGRGAQPRTDIVLRRSAVSGACQLEDRRRRHHGGFRSPICT